MPKNLCTPDVKSNQSFHCLLNYFTISALENGLMTHLPSYLRRSIGHFQRVRNCPIHTMKRENCWENWVSSTKRFMLAPMIACCIGKNTLKTLNVTYVMNQDTRTLPIMKEKKAPHQKSVKRFPERFYAIFH